MVIYLGEVIRLKCTVKNFDNNLTDPTSHEIKVYDGGGTLLATITNPAYGSQGVYHYDYVIPTTASKGMFYYVWKTTSSGQDSIEELHFEVFETGKDC